MKVLAFGETGAIGALVINSQVEYSHDVYVAYSRKMNLEKEKI